MASNNFNHFPKIAAVLKPVCSLVVRKTALDIVAGYQARAPRETSFMANSAYIVTSKESTYGRGGVAPRKGALLLPEVEKPSDDTTAYAAVAANYAIFPELGTRYAPAQPAFYPAVEAARGSFDAAVALINEKLNEAAR